MLGQLLLLQTCQVAFGRDGKCWEGGAMVLKGLKCPRVFQQYRGSDRTRNLDCTIPGNCTFDELLHPMVLAKYCSGPVRKRPSVRKQHNTLDVAVANIP